MSLNSLSFASLYPTSFMSVMTADDTPLPLTSISSVITTYLSLSHVYHIPNLTLNLVFVAKLCDFGYVVSISSTSCFLQDPQSQKLIGTGCKRGGVGGLYILDELEVPIVVALSFDLF